MFETTRNVNELLSGSFPAHHSSKLLFYFNNFHKLSFALLRGLQNMNPTQQFRRSSRGERNSIPRFLQALLNDFPEKYFVCVKYFVWVITEEEHSTV